jgi:hypothetical protein
MSKKNRYNLEIVFDSVLEKSYKLRKKNPDKFDGLGFWQPIKQILEQYDIYNSKKWKKIAEEKTKKIMNLTEYTINGHGNKIINEKNHFIIQQVRIPFMEKPTIKKIVQIALNIGQYNGLTKNNIKFDNISDFLYKKDIIELSKYISIEIVEKINKYLTSL